MSSTSATPPSNFPALPSTFHIQVLRPQELLSDPPLLKELMQLVNGAYTDTHLKLEASLGQPSHSVFNQLRLNSETQLVEELPNDASWLALMFHNKEEGGQNASRAKLVAVASIKKWKGTVMQRHWRTRREEGATPPDHNTTPYDPRNDISLDPQPDAFEDWEIATCASLPQLEYRGMGFIARLNDTLLDRLRQSLARKNDTEILGEIGHANPPGTKPIRLWVSALDGSINKDYWIKRGYTLAKPTLDTAPPGTWGNAQDVGIWTLYKILS